MAMSTTGEFIANVQNEIEGLQTKIASLDEKKAEIDKQINDTRLDIKRRRDLLLVWEGKADVRPMMERKVRERARRGFTMNSVILDILENANRHMSAHEILDDLKNRNAEGNSKSPISSVRNAREMSSSTAAPVKTIRRPGGGLPE